MDEHRLTDGQREDLRRLRRYIERHDLRRIMNTTKWNEAVAVIRALPRFPISFRAKWVSERDPPPWESSFPWHVPQPYLGIEWLDVRTTARFMAGGEWESMDTTEALLAGLRSYNIPFTYTDKVVRIWGYLRPGATVQFDEPVREDGDTKGGG